MSFLNKLFGNKKESKKEDKIESLQNTKLHCPYCNVLIDELPKRKKKCQNCEGYYYPNKRDSDHNLISEEEYKKNKENEKKARFRDKWVFELSRYGISEKAYNDYKKKYSEKIKFSENENDVIWSMFNKLITQNSTNFDILKNIYLSMFHYLREERKDGFKLLQLSHDCGLRDALNHNLNLNAVIIAAKDSCDNCKKLDGKIFTIQEALEKKPLPHKDCSNSFCRCLYGFEPIRDKNGNLIL